MTSVGEPIYWVGFLVFVMGMLAVDLFVFNRKSHEVSVKEAAAWSIVWITLSLSFAGFVWWRFGSGSAAEYVTGWLIEKALSVDNIFVFVVLFGYFRVPKELQHRVLFWGVLGALVLRAIFIVLGAEMIQRFSWVMYIFGAFLVFTGLKMLRTTEDEEIEPEKNFIYRLFTRMMPLVPNFRGNAFFVRENGKRYATPLFLVLVMVEFTDLLFAVDSIPAVFAVTRDPFIVFTSNIFAILGLRALYFVVGTMVGKFRFLKIGLAVVLSFVGTKMLIVQLWHVPILLSLGVIIGVLTISIVASTLYPEQAEETTDPSDPPKSVERT